MERSMSDPASGAVGATVAHKVVPFVGAAAAVVLAFVLGLQVIPLDERDPHRDMVRRLLGCAVSSFLLGLPLLIYMHRELPWFYQSSRDLMVTLQMTPELGPWAVTWSVLLLAALPGWWLVGALVRKFASWRDKDIGQIVDDVKAEVR